MRFFRFMKFTLIFILFLFLAIGISFTIITHKLQYEMPLINIIKLYDKDNNEYLSLANNNKQSYVKLDDISGYLIDAFISLEDKDFYSHQGIDISRIISATLKNISKNDYVEGASTITQQYVKNLFLSSEKTIKRKIYEIFISLNIESKYSKKQILEGYLNSIYFDHGLYGVEDASLYYFNKHAKDLNLLEAVTLASIPKSPGNYSPIKNPKNNEERRNLALKEMLDDSFINEYQYQNALNDELKLTGINIKNEENSAPWYQDYVISELNKIQSIKKYSHLGLKVYTSLDLEFTKQINEIVNKRLPDSGIAVSIIAADPKTGKVLALIGGNDYSKSTYNHALYSLRQPGSTVKPFLYLSALENGLTVSSTFKSEATTFYLPNGTYSPHNFQEIYANQDVSMVYALATSDNIYAMKTHLFLGEEKLVDKLKTFGITSELSPLPSLALGTLEVSLFDLTSCYSVLANLGKKVNLSCIEKIETMDGEIIYENNYPTKQLANSSDVYILNEAMTSVFDNNLTINIRPTCASIASLMKNTFSAKSGSTDTDNWIFGYNQDLVVGVWTGYDDNRKIEKLEDLRFGKYIWADIVNAYFQDKKSSWYETPQNVVRFKLNPITGFYANLYEYTKYLYFKEDNVPWFISLIN